MENIVNIKRRAQKLVQDGNYAEAIEQYSALVEMGDLDPYDYVVLGDLLLRDSRKYDAVARYREALAAYTRGGLFRNAIAIAKRIRRLVPENSAIQRELGNLYSSEGLHTEAALHFIEYLDRARGEEDFADSAEEVARRLLDSPLPSFELVPRIVAVLQEVNRGPAVALGVLRQARRAGKLNQATVEKTLVELAQSLDASVLDREGEIETPMPPAHAPAPPAFMDVGAVSLEGGPGEAFAEDPSVVHLGADDAADVPVLSLDDPGADPMNTGMVNLDDALSSADLNDALDAEPNEPGVVSLDESPSAVREYVLDPDDGFAADEPGVVRFGDGPDASASDDVAFESSELGSDEDPEEIVARAERAFAKGDVIVAQREYLRAAGEYFRQGDHVDAERLYGRIVKLDPNHLEALRMLVEIAHAQGDTDKMARHGCELGDVYLAREMYDEARVQFERVLAFDPSNAKATSRLNRLETLSRPVEEDDELRVGEEVDASTVTVRDEASAPTQTAMDLAAILEEFRSAVVERIPAEDGRAHYDMGMSYLEMGLVEEASNEFELAAEDEELRTRALEMLAESYLRRERGQEALEVLRDLIAGVDDPESQARLAFAEGRAYEILGLTQEAQEAYYRALELNEDLVEAMERLNDLTAPPDESAA